MDIATLWIFFAVFLASFVGSFTGFGFALFLVPALLITMSPKVAVPLVLILDLLIGFVLFPKIRKEVDWVSLKWLLPSAAIGVPFGLLVLEKLPASPLKIAIAIFALISAMVLASGFRLKKQSNLFISSLTGTLSGFLGASIGIAGPPVIIFYFASPKKNSESRASIIAYFFILGIFTTALLFIRNQVSTEVLNLLVMLLPIEVLGIWLGNKMYSKISPDLFRKFIFILLFLLAVSILVREIWV